MEQLAQSKVVLEEARARLAALVRTADKAVIKEARKCVRDAESKVRMYEHIANVVSAWPPPTPWQVHRVVTLLYGGGSSSRIAEPERPEVIAVRKAEAELSKVRKSFREAMAGCHGCGLDRKAHAFQQSYATGYHDFQELSPEGAIKVAQIYKKKIAAAEKALEAARVA